MRKYLFPKILALLVVFSAVGFAAPRSVRWTGKDDRNANIVHVIDVIKAKTGVALSLNALMLLEDRAMAHSHFTMLVPTVGGVALKNQSLRIWTTLNGDDAIQVEAIVDDPPTKSLLDLAVVKLTSQETMQMVRQVVQSHLDDREIRSVDWKDFWDNAGLVRVVRVKGKHGTHTITLSHSPKRVIESRYQEFPQVDAMNSGDSTGEFSVPVRIYPIYEEVAHDFRALLPRQASELRYLQPTYPLTTTDPYLSLRQQRYLESKFDPFLGLTEDGRKQGYWAMSYLKMLAGQLLAAVKPATNSFSSGGVVLDGRFASVSYYPEVTSTFKNLSFTPQISAQFKPDWKPMPEKPTEMELIPSAALRGRPIASLEDAWNRPARRLADHDPSSYINDGFDELQVYWAVNQLFDSLRGMGFTDPELATRRFNAFLYDPDISYRDNAFYTDDTINFTTYSPSQPNMARDNSTIWHELGHGVMDRLMGDYIVLADTGGLSEGMADFVAQLVLNDVTKGQSYPGKESLRIFNNTGFYLTNEVHDDGEAYGGTMNDLLRAAMKQDGQDGLTKVTDLTLETMRLTRNHPGLTAVDWFGHMIFADELGNEPLRKAGELSPLIHQALAGRNFNLDGSPSAALIVKNGNDELTSTGPGSRENPVPLKLKAAESASYHLTVNLKSTPSYQFKYPVTVKVGFTGGPLQGAIHWAGKDQSPLTYTLASESDTVKLDLSAIGKCDQVNRPDGSCSDFAYIQIWNDGETRKPQAKKRFYLRIFPQAN